jgi:cob(I)alamin adenosyltransferase
MTKFYTKTGDDGYTGLLGEGRAAKDDPIIETIGNLDETNAALGYARSISKASKTSAIILIVQKDLYQIMTEISVTPENRSKFQKLSAERITWLENQIFEITNEITVPNQFIVPGDTQSGAAIDVARAIVRRSERHVAGLLHRNIIENPQILRFLNRLSSLCFALELLENQESGFSQPTLAKE